MSICKVETENKIAIVTIDRPPANATNRAAYDDIRDTFYALDRRDDIKAVILTGAGKIFMAGNELGEFKYFMTPAECTSYYDTIRNAYLAVKNCRLPVIGAINGAAAGAGLAFAGCCDVLVAAEHAKFMLSEIKVGIIGADGFASLLVPEKVLRYMAFSGNAITAEEIASWGGILKVVPRDELLDEAKKIASEFTQNARRSLILWKECLNKNYEHNLAEKFANNLQSTIDYQPYHDFREASAAFSEKRPPEYDEK
ncbi:MAG: enoyl-CoA hydratase/isomerase family protein [Selenomonadaceae bacterium]